MDIWELFGIEPTEDISKIKSAYARQARLYHPEEHPEEFKTLQNAYKVALQMAKGKKAGVILTYAPPGQKTEAGREQTESETAETESDADRAEPEAENAKTAREFDFSSVDAYGERGRFIGQFLLLAKNPYLQNNLEAWDYFLNLDAHAGLFPNTAFRREMVQAICSLKGWRRKTILYFERFYLRFMCRRISRKTENGKPICVPFKRKSCPGSDFPPFAWIVFC